MSMLCVDVVYRFQSFLHDLTGLWTGAVVRRDVVIDGKIIHVFNIIIRLYGGRARKPFVVFTTCRVIEKINFYTLVYYVWDKQSFVRAVDKMHSVYYRTYGAVHT